MVAEHYLRFYRSEHGLDFTANLAALERGSAGCYCISTGVRTSVNAGHGRPQTRRR
ncbi:MAG: hypothetical protein ACYDFS_02440 [Vulcanimicrobiaceae bacterium]